MRKCTSYFKEAVSSQSMKSIDFKNSQFIEISETQFKAGKVDSDISELFKTSEKNYPKQVLIVLKTALNVFEHAKKDASDDKDDLTGVFFVPVIINDKGILQHCLDKHLYPWIPRNLLNPIEEHSTILGSLSSYETFLSQMLKEDYSHISWLEFIAYLENMFYAVTNQDLWSDSIISSNGNSITFDENLYLIEYDFIDATKNILDLYAKIEENDIVRLPLYDNFTTNAIKANMKLHDSYECHYMHVAQMNGEYGLSESQRISANQFNNMKNGEILAIKGPPGTGKTTLLQTLVANLFVTHALAEKDAPIIVATSTNNQAVTNIIDSFTNIKKTREDALDERWIHGVNGFALYHPSLSKCTEARKKDYQYHAALDQDFGAMIDDTKNIKKSKEKMLENAAAWFHDKIDSIEECKYKIHHILSSCNAIQIKLYESVDKALYLTGGRKLKEFEVYIEENIHDLQKEKELHITRLHQLEEEIERMRQRLMEWEDFIHEIPIWRRAFSFIPFIKKAILRKVAIFMNQEERSAFEINSTYTEIQDRYVKWIYDHSMKMKTIQEKIQMKEEKQAVFHAKEAGLERIFRTIQEHLMVLKEDHVLSKIQVDKLYTTLIELEIKDIDKEIDIGIRYFSFWMAIHYYECRWIQEENLITEKQRGRNFKNVVEKVLKRNALVILCNVVTSYRLPSLFQYYDDKQLFHFNMADLLIVDEAGQVSCEIAAGAFAMAKKAIVVGDEQQIAPVWSVPRPLDITLAKKHGIIGETNDFELLEETGLNCSQSSVMKVACNRSNYDVLGKGLFLSEHRRCYNEIIEYSNELVYKGGLQPLRGFGSEDHKYPFKNLPHMGYYEIHTEDSQTIGTSRINKEEAKQIAQWVFQNFDTLTKAYDIEDNGILGIITPFAKQAQILKNEFKKISSELANKVDIGTVHTFQGAEKKIIIFSITYGSKNRCSFINSNKNLMNVAVSRAKDAFLVFGNYEVLQGSRNTATGLLHELCKNEVANKVVLVKNTRVGE